MPPGQFSFLEQFILDELNKNGFNKLTADDQTALFPQFVAESERRLGLALVPHIKSEADAEQFSAMLEKAEATPEDWYLYWKRVVPQFDALVKQTLSDYVKELQSALAL